MHWTSRAPTLVTESAQLLTVSLSGNNWLSFNFKLLITCRILFFHLFTFSAILLTPVLSLCICVCICIYLSIYRYTDCIYVYIDRYIDRFLYIYIYVYIFSLCIYTGWIWGEKSLLSNFHSNSLFAHLAFSNKQCALSGAFSPNINPYAMEIWFPPSWSMEITILRVLWLSENHVQGSFTC
jgi:hypothetical protein